MTNKPDAGDIYGGWAHFKFNFLNLFLRQTLIRRGDAPDRALEFMPRKALAMLSFLSQKSGGPAWMSARDAVSRSGAGDLLVIDVREGAEVAASGKARGALHVPLAVLRMKCDPASPECLAELSVDRPVALYCASGGRSQMAAHMLAGLGYREVYNIGGLDDWHAAGGAIAR